MRESCGDECECERERGEGEGEGKGDAPAVVEAVAESYCLVYRPFSVEVLRRASREVSEGCGVSRAADKGSRPRLCA